MENNRHSYSLRKILAVVLAVLIPVSLGGIFFILFTIKDTQRQEAEAMAASVESQVQRVSAELERENNYLVDLLYNNFYMGEIRQASGVNQRNVAAREILEQFECDSVIWGSNFSFACYMPSENLVFSKFNYSFPYEENLVLRQWFSEQISRGLLESSSLSWTSVRQGESVYLYQAYHFDGVYLVAWASGDGLFSGIKANTLSAQGEIVYLQPGEVRAVKDVAEDFCLELSPEYTDIRIVVTDQPYLEWGRFSVMIGFVVFILLVVLGVSVYTLQYYRRYVQTPLDHFVRHVGEYAAQRQTVKRGGIQELNDAVEAFDDLSRQIKKLRIDLYEEKLALAQTEMEYYQLQIKPHFFVNCFSLIHAMAQKQEYQRIQEFCVKLSNYVRYLFSQSLSLVPLERELSMVREFLGIQQIRHRVNVQLREEIDGSIQGLAIPPLSLLTFVENAVKHGGSRNVGIEIKVEVPMTEKGKRLRLSIQDTGVGFPEEMLGVNPKLEEGSQQGRHLGIRNIQKRLQFLYGENFTLEFQNNSQGGLVVLEFPCTNAP